MAKPNLPCQTASKTAEEASSTPFRQISGHKGRFSKPRSPSSSPQLPRLLQHLIVAWLIAATIEYLLLPSQDKPLAGLAGLGQLSGGRMAVVTAGLLLLFQLIPRLLAVGSTLRWLMAGATAVYGAACLLHSFSWPFLLGCMVIGGLMVIYGRYGWNGAEEVPIPSQKDGLPFALGTGFVAVAFFLFVSLWTVSRVRSFSTPTYDFGIFSQMFYSMKQTGLPMTTVERDGLLSHFAVHVSPIYYLMLPFYCLVPRPETLQVMQAAILASAVLPLWLLGKHHGLHPGLRMLVCVLLLVYPSYAGGTSYDLHENCFLPCLLLWLLYGIDRKSVAITAAFSGLTLLVKEDAAVFVAVVGLYLLLRSCLRRDRWGVWAGSLLLIGALGWFLAVTGYLARHGDGVMNYRYSNFMYGQEKSLLAVIKAVLLCPMKAVYECMDEKKLSFLGCTLGALLGLPLLTRRYERYLLLIPYLLVNLMSDYQYQHDILYQYTYGPTSCLIYLVVINLADLAGSRRLILSGLACVLCFGCFCYHILPVASYHVDKCSKYEEYYDNQRSLLDTIPDGASVASTTYYTAYLSNRSALYDLRYCSEAHIWECEYVVIKVSEESTLERYAEGDEDGLACLVRLLEEEGYVLERRLPEVLDIYHRSDSVS